ncbi:MAG: hypothetical protein WA874_07955 [Chryseosolibacter sp.]
MTEREIKDLADSSIYLGKTLHGTLEETHISWIILTTRIAFKIKKPLKLSFLDFSTLARRKRYCERELLLNRRFSGIYQRVVPVKFHDGAWRLGGGAGKIADYAVVMKRLDSSKRMDLLLQSGKVRASQIRALAKKIASFHRKTTIIRRPFSTDSSAEAFNDIRVILEIIEKDFSKKYADIVRRSGEWSDGFLLRYKKRFRERIGLGFQRDVHGDLHSGNIFLYRTPEIFDCIEFNDRYRQIDVLNEIAFFCMDLEAFGYQKLAALFVVEYNRLFPCFLKQEDQYLFAYFKCYRANVRAKVHALAAAQEENPSRYRTHADAVRKYLLLMEGYMKHPEWG